MNYYKCNECGQVFSENEADVVHTTYESMYGVSDLFPNSTPCSYYSCPYCGSEDLNDEGEYSSCAWCDVILSEDEFYSFYERGSIYNYCFECWLEKVVSSEDAIIFWKNYFDSKEFKNDCIHYEMTEDFESVKDKSIESILRFFKDYNEEFITFELDSLNNYLKEIYLNKKKGGNK